MTRHYGMFEFKEGIRKAEIENCFAVMQVMVGKIPGLLDMEHGPYDSPVGPNDGYTHSFIMTFDSPESREAYLPHPIHDKVKEEVVPKLEGVVVFDFKL